MKRLYLILLLATVTLCGLAQTVGDAFYIYRNDGQFNAFFRDEVDSITYSNFDIDSVFYDEVVTQVVYTPDSLYRIPLSAIDSVSFVTPETIINASVFPLTSEHSPYITEADTLQFSMSINTPARLLPNVGNIVVATADCYAFPDGIIAKVENRQRLGDTYRFSCSLASIDDVFDQILVYSSQAEVEIDNPVDESRAFNLHRASLTSELWNKQWTKTISGGGTTTTLTVGDRATVTVTARKTLTTPFFFQLQLQNALTSSINFNAKSSVGYWQEVQIGNTISAGKITIPYTAGLLWLTPKLSLYGYFEEEGKVELNYSGHFNRTDRVIFTYTKGQWTFNHAPSTNVGTDVASLNMEGHAEVGLRPQIDFSLNGRRAGFGMSAKVGLKEYINFTFDLTKLSNGGLYDAMRDSYCRTTIPWSLTAHASADVFRKYDSYTTEVGFATFSYTFGPKTEPRWGDDRYIFPLFSNVDANRNNEQKTVVTAKTQISRTPLLPVEVGFSLLDKDKNIIQTKYDSRTYQNGSLFSDYNVELTGLKTSDDYIVRPSVKLMGCDVLASPEVEVKAGETTCPDHNHPHWIDLGLPSGTQWRCCNEGASTPEDYGGYYTFGQVASAPSLDQIKELLNHTTSVWTQQNGVNGRKFTGSNGGTIFLPAAGCGWHGGFYDVGSTGFYWSSTPDNERYAFGLCFSSGFADWGTYGFGRNGEQSVRPVR